MYSKIGIYGGNPIQPYIATIVRLSACEVKPLSETPEMQAKAASTRNYIPDYESAIKSLLYSRRVLRVTTVKCCPID